MELLQADYGVINIADEEAALAPSFIKETNFFPMTVAVMLTMLLLTLAVLYYMQCKKYRSRIAYLCGTEKSLFSGWNLMRLKEEVREMEFEAVGPSSGI